jgi:hypothetical protein
MYKEIRLKLLLEHLHVAEYWPLPHGVGAATASLANDRGLIECDNNAELAGYRLTKGGQQYRIKTRRRAT